MEKTSKETIVGTYSVELLRENPDGSADFQFNFPKEALDALTRLGILTAIKAGIEDAKRLNPDVDAGDMTQERVVFSDKLRHIAEEAGFILWAEEDWKPEGAVVDWACEYDDELVKFAQLIVRECVEVSKQYNFHERTKIAMLEHFGMKESDWK